MSEKKMLPVGVANFEKLIDEGFYYVDKTLFIKELMTNRGEVNLFTRPRRFGKTLTMSMLQHFLEYGQPKELFQGLKIAGENAICEKYMGQFPVVSVSFKDVEGGSFEDALAEMSNMIGNEALRFKDLIMEHPQISSEDKIIYAALTKIEQTRVAMDRDTVASSLYLLTYFLHKCYNKRVILLVDEYDVPLDKAFQHGYYDDMVSLIRDMFVKSMKDNSYLEMATLTGCLRISKESIFTGFNNTLVLTITDTNYDEFFGFTEQEVHDMLSYYDLSASANTVKEWYDGYLFGTQNIYCPWDVLNYLFRLRSDRDSVPEPYWINTSGNGLLMKFIEDTGIHAPEELEDLIARETVDMAITQEVTYRELEESEENIFSVLFMTGYLTVRERPTNHIYPLVIPNKGIREIFVRKVKAMFQQSVKEDRDKVTRLGLAFMNGDSATAETIFNDYLDSCISIRDTNVRNEMKENFYHGYLLGILSVFRGVRVKSNNESGDGYADIIMESRRDDTGVVIEVKYALDGKWEKGCQDALHQIEQKQYEKSLIQHGINTIRKYGIACWKKRCKIMQG